MARGFTLVEVLVAVLAVGAAVALYTGVLYTLALTRTSDYKATALRIAQDKLAQLRADGYGALPATGTFADARFSQLPAGATSTLTVTTVNAQVKRIVAGVSWRERERPTSTVSVSTLLIQNGGL